VRDIDGRDSDGILDLLDDRPHLNPQFRVQIAQRFIHQQDIRLDDQSTRQGDPLLLAAGQLLRHPIGIFINVHQLHEFVGLLLDRCLVHLPVLQAEGHIVPDRQMRENRIVLKHHADVPFRRINVVHLFVIEVDAPALDAVEAGDHPQQCCLPASRWTKEGEELTLLDIQRQVRDHGGVTISLDDFINFDVYTHIPSPLNSLIRLFCQISCRQTCCRTSPATPPCAQRHTGCPHRRH